MARKVLSRNCYLATDVAPTCVMTRLITGYCTSKGSYVHVCTSKKQCYRENNGKPKYVQMRERDCCFVLLVQFNSQML